MLTTLVILATIAVAALAWHQLSELKSESKESRRDLAPIRVRVEDEYRPRRRR